MLIKTTTSPLQGCTQVPGDKSISHRSVIFGALAEGRTVVQGFLPGEDCLATIDCFRRMGVRIEQQGTTVTIDGVGLHGLKQPDGILYTGNSGTTTRLLLGLLSGQKFAATITGDASIERRPMRRVVEPLKAMGANITGRENGNFAPLTVLPVPRLSAITYHLPIASAQVKSALLLAGLYAHGETTIVEPTASRDHTEIMLKYFGAAIKRNGLSTTVAATNKLSGRKITVPGDISSAAFLMVAALIIPGSEITIENVGINPTRAGIIEVLKAMGADIELIPKVGEGLEPIADIRVRYSALQGTEIAGAIIPRLIDEIPALAIAACYANGTTVIRDAAELKVKESNRIAAIVDGLTRMGVKAKELPDGLVIHGQAALTGAAIDSNGDHRIAMAFAVAGLRAKGVTEIINDDCIPVSFPGFADTMRALGAAIDCVEVN